MEYKDLKAEMPAVDKVFTILATARTPDVFEMLAALSEISTTMTQTEIDRFDSYQPDSHCPFCG